MNTDFEPIKNGVKFEKNLKNYSAEIEVGGYTLSINSCDFSKGVEVTFDANCTISSSKIHKSCYIGSNITNCIYDSDGTLTINDESQNRTRFKFNKISISSINIGNNGKIIIRSDDHELNINCDITTSTNNVITINNSGTINIGCENFGILIQGPDETLTINNSGSMAINGTKSASAINCIGTLTINNSGIMTINNDLDKTGALDTISNSGKMTISNSGKMIINSSNGIISNNAANDLTTFTNSSTVEFNLHNSGFLCSGTNNINITDSLFSYSSDNNTSRIFFTSTPSIWNGRTFTNNSEFSFEKTPSGGTASITSYFNSYPSSITLEAKEQILTEITGNIIENTTNSPLTLCSGPIPLTNPIIINNGVVSLGPKSSLYLPQTLKLSENVILVRGNVTLDKPEQNFSIILNETDEPLMEEENATTFGRIVLQPHSSFEFPLDFEIPPTVSIIIGNQAKVNNCDISGNSSVLLGKSIENLSINCGKVSIG